MAEKRRRRSSRSPGIWDGLYGPVEIRRIQPYQATKSYMCPGCHRELPPGLGHVVAVPRDAPDLRRHWHHACWRNRVPRT